MFYRTQNMTLNRDLAVALAACFGARPAAALLGTLTMRLYTNAGLAPLPDTLFATFNEAAFSGYAAATLGALIGPVVSPPLTVLVHQEGDFAADAGIGAGATVYGYYLTNAPATLWYAAEQFVVPGTNTPAPFNFASPGDFLSVDAAVAAMMQLALNL